MVSPIALPTFVTGPDDKLATIDPYKIASSQVVNEIGSLLGGVNIDIASDLSGFSKLDISSITKGILSNAKLPISQKELLGKVTSAFPNIASNIKTMDIGLKNIISGGMSSLTSSIGISGSGISGLINVGNLDIANQFKDYLGNITGNLGGLNISNLSEQVNLYGSAIKTALNLNISGVTKDIFSVVADRQVFSLLSKELAPSLINSSAATDLFNLANKLTGSSLSSSYPSILSDFSNKFNKSNFFSGVTNVDTYTQIMDTYDCVAPDWNTYSRSGDDTGGGTGDGNIFNVSKLVSSSDDLTKVISGGVSGSSTSKDLVNLVAQFANKKSVVDQLKSQFPQTVLNVVSSLTKVEDPRIKNTKDPFLGAIT